MKYLLFTLLLVFTNYTIFSQNLIINPGAELNPTANGWTQLSGSWVQAQESVKSGATNPQAAHEGDYHFFAGAGAGSLELYQDIDVSGYASAIDAGLQDFAFSGWVRDWSGNDGSNIIVEYRSASSTVLSTYDSGEQIVTSWTEMTDSRTASVNTRSIRIRLISIRHDGTDNDDYFDDLSLTTTYTGTQSPGGVSANNVFWVKANEGVAVSGSNVSSWADRSGNSNDASQATSVNQPSYTNVQRNYNPSVYFDGTDEYMGMTDLIPSGNTEMSIYAVGTTETGGDVWGTMVYGQSNAGLSGGYGLSELKGDGNIGFWVNAYNVNYVDTTWSNNSLSIIEGIYDGANVNLYIDADAKGDDAYTSTIGDNGNTYIGGEANSYNHKGYISEVAIYSSALSATDRSKLNSYFAIKYGITLNRVGNPNYVASNGTAIFNTPSATYWNDIIGIGRDDDSGLNQKQSHTTDDTLKIHIANLANSNNNNSGSFTNDLSYMILGSNDGKMHATTASNSEAPTGINTRIEREWRMAFYNFADVAKMQFQLGSKDWDDITASDLVVLWDNDGDFSDATILEPDANYVYNFNSTTGVLTFSVNLAIFDSSTPIMGYITVGSKSSDSPLPIDLIKFEGKITSNNLVRLDWQTATETNNDYFTIERSQNISQWLEISEIDGLGNSNYIHSYNSIDESPLNGISYYRLKQTDFDGKYSYSNIVTIDNTNDEVNKLTIYPNPTTGIITIEGVIGMFNDYHIYNITGQDVVNKVNVLTISASQITMDISTLPKGVYILYANNQHIKLIKE